MTAHRSPQSSRGQGASSISPPKAWQATLGELELQVTSDTFEMYLHPTRFVAYEDGTFLIAVPNGFVKEWLEHRYNRVVTRTLQHIMNRAVEVKYMVEAAAPRNAVDPSPPPLFKLAEQEAEPPPTTLNGASEGQPLVAGYTFDNFIVGSNNRIAHAASLAVAEQPGSRFNPLFIYSGVGLGKTHLLHAIGHQVRQAGYKAVYVSCEMFTNELVMAIRLGSTEQFRAKYRTSDVLLLDDVQFLAGKPTTQEELFHTFNALHATGRQVVLASDRPPKAISTLENRLRSRFEWGLIADIQAPNLEMRLAILQAKAVAQGVVVPDTVLERIATLVPSNVRELEGALTKVVAHASLSDTAMTAEVANAILADMMPPRAQVEPAVVLALVARAFGVGVADLTGTSRKRETVQARQVAMYLLREVLDMSFAHVGEHLGGKDHATAIYGVRKITDLLQEDEELQRQVGSLQERLLMPEPIHLRPQPP